MLELAILGFLYDAPLHGYELRKRITALTGHVKPVAESTLYPAIKRLEKAGLLARATEPGAVAAPRHVLTLTEQGRQELRHRHLSNDDEAHLSIEFVIDGRRPWRWEPPLAIDPNVHPIGAGL